MTEHKLREYLFSREWNAELESFVEHAKYDPRLPDAKSWLEWKNYLEGMRVFPGNEDRLQAAIYAAHLVWQEYERRNFRVIK